MARANSTKSNKAEKQRKAHGIFPHAKGKWAKKYAGRTVYLTRVADDPDGIEAITRWVTIQEGGDPDATHEARLTVSNLVNLYLAAKKPLADSGEITAGHFSELKKTGARLVRVLGAARDVEKLGPADFIKLRADITKGRGVHATGTEITRCRQYFNYAMRRFRILVAYGDEFAKPAKRHYRLNREKNPKLCTPAEIRSLIDAAGDQLGAMLRLAINAGLGNSECCELPISAIDFAGGWLSWYRPKTGLPRRAKLWPETIAAVQAVVDSHPPTDDQELRRLVFRTKQGQAWTKTAVSHEFLKLAKPRTKENPRGLGIRRPGLTFYSARHSFKTVAENGTGDRVAVDYAMGHAGGDSSSDNYRWNVADERLQRIAECVRVWLNSTTEGGRQ